MATPVALLHAHWHYFFDHVQYSTQEFYMLVESAIKSREFPGVHLKRVTFQEGGMLSNSREYLRVTRHEFVFDICAAPFGTGFFISWWLGEPAGCNFLERLPIIGRLFRTIVTYYRLDTETMFKEGIHISVQEAIEGLSSTKGLRALSFEEKRITDIK